MENGKCTIKIELSDYNADTLEMIREIKKKYEAYLIIKYGKATQVPRGYLEEEMGKPVMVNNWFAGDKLKHEIRYAKYFGKDENGNAKLKIHFYDDSSVVVKIEEVNNNPTAPEGESVLSKEMDLEQRQHRLDRLNLKYAKGNS